MTATSPVVLVTGASSGIGKAATAPKPRRRYTAGSTAARISVFRRVAPAWAFDRGVRKLDRMVG